VRGLNFTKLGEVIGRSFLHKKFVSESLEENFWHRYATPRKFNQPLFIP